MPSCRACRGALAPCTVRGRAGGQAAHEVCHDNRLWLGSKSLGRRIVFRPHICKKVLWIEMGRAATVFLPRESNTPFDFLFFVASRGTHIPQFWSPGFWRAHVRARPTADRGQGCACLPLAPDRVSTRIQPRTRSNARTLVSRPLSLAWAWIPGYSSTQPTAAR